MIVSKEPNRRRYIDFRPLRADNSIVSGLIWQKFELIQVSMDVLFTCKSEKDQIKNIIEGWKRPLYIIGLWGFFFKKKGSWAAS